MLSIMNVTNGELIPNPLHQLIAEYLSSSSPDWMVISTIILAVGTAVLVIVTYYYARQTRRLVGQTERLATSTEQSVTQASHFGERINEKYDPIIKIGRPKGWPKDKSGIIDVGWEMLSPLVEAINYFAYLVLLDQIKDEKVLGYYRGRLSGYIATIMRHYASPNIRLDLRDQYHDFNRLIERWNINMPDEET